MARSNQAPPSPHAQTIDMSRDPSLQLPQFDIPEPPTTIGLTNRQELIQLVGALVHGHLLLTGDECRHAVRTARALLEYVDTEEAGPLIGPTPTTRQTKERVKPPTFWQRMFGA